jgi:hypothetical protein
MSTISSYNVLQKNLKNAGGKQAGKKPKEVVIHYTKNYQFMSKKSR